MSPSGKGKGESRRAIAQNRRKRPGEGLQVRSLGNHYGLHCLNPPLKWTSTLSSSAKDTGGGKTKGSIVGGGDE